MNKIRLVKKYNYHDKNYISYTSEIALPAPKINTIIDFLFDEIQEDVDRFRDFVDDKTRLGRGGDAVSIEKDDNNHDILIIDEEWHDCDETCPSRVVMHKDDFLKILNDWEKVYSQKSDEIIITQDENGKISITGKFTDGREI